MNSLVKTTDKSLSVGNYSKEQVETIKNVICQGANDSEVQLFMGYVAKTGLDPLSRQIYFIKSGGRPIIQTSIDGFRVIAERTGKYDGQEPAQWCGMDGVWVDVWLKDSPPAAARVSVRKKGISTPITAVALFKEYGKKTGVWSTMPALMLAKCAEALALRKAFPNDLSGIYSSDEILSNIDQEDLKTLYAASKEAGFKSKEELKEAVRKYFHRDESFKLTELFKSDLDVILKNVISNHQPEVEVISEVEATPVEPEPKEVKKVSPSVENRNPNKPKQRGVEPIQFDASMDGEFPFK